MKADNWPILLAQFIEQRRHVPFGWGTNDCCLFGADWVLRATSKDLAADLRGRYGSALGAARILGRCGGVRSLIKNRGEQIGIQSVPSRSIQRGDLVVAEMGRGESIGISLGNVAAFVSRDGLIFAPFDFQINAPCWRF